MSLRATGLARDSGIRGLFGWAQDDLDHARIRLSRYCCHDLRRAGHLHSVSRRRTNPAPDDARSREEGFRCLYEAHLGEVLGYAIRRVPDSHDAADVVAETFLVAWRRFDDLPSSDDLRAWLLGVARRVLANQRRGGERRARLSDRLGAALVASSTATPDTESHEQRAVRDALGRLSDDDRELLSLTSWEGLSPSELAQIFDVTPETVRTRLSRARQRMRVALEVVLDDQKEGA